jgi:DNA repair protein RecO (recombination protein O)
MPSSSHARVYTTEAVVLRRIDFGEADRILTLFTPAYGRIRAVAKGVRRTTSRLAGHLEPFTRTQLLLAKGRDLDIVTQAEGRERLDNLRGSLWHMSAAWYCSELIDRFLEDADPHPSLYHLYVQTLRLLDDGASTPDQRSRCWLGLRYFELRLLGELGYRPALHNCAGCDTPLRPESNGFSAELGGVLCQACSRYAQRRLSLPAFKVLRLLQTTTWEGMPKLRLEADVQQEIEGVLQAALRYHLDKDLKSWNFLSLGRS